VPRTGDIHVVDLQADVHAARVRGPGIMGGLGSIQVMHQLERHSARKVEPARVDAHARVADEGADLRPLEHSAVACGHPQQSLPEGDRPLQLADGDADVMKRLEAHL